MSSSACVYVGPFVSYTKKFKEELVVISTNCDECGLKQALIAKYCFNCGRKLDVMTKVSVSSEPLYRKVFDLFEDALFHVPEANSSKTVTFIPNEPLFKRTTPEDTLVEHAMVISPTVIKAEEEKFSTVYKEILSKLDEAYGEQGKINWGYFSYYY